VEKIGLLTSTWFIVIRAHGLGLGILG